jgi:hypothetical protein
VKDTGSYGRIIADYWIDKSDIRKVQVVHREVVIEEV